MNKFKTAIAAMGLAAAMSSGSVASYAQTQSRQTAKVATPAVPNEVLKAAIATRSDKQGKIAAAAIGNTGHYVVYIKTLAVGFLPILQMPQVDKGMPRLGITTYGNDGKPKVAVVTYNGQGYGSPNWDNLVAPNSGKVILSESMLKSF